MYIDNDHAHSTMVNSMSRQELLNKLKNYYKKFGKVPKKSDCGDTLPSYYHFRRHFGGLKKALELAGFPTCEESMLEDLIFNDGIPSKYCYSHYDTVFGSIYEARELAGLENKKVTKENLINSLKRFYEENGRMPKCEDCSKTKYLYSVGTYIKYFGSWKLAKNEAKNEL